MNMKGMARDRVDIRSKFIESARIAKCCDFHKLLISNKFSKSFRFFCENWQAFRVVNSNFLVFRIIILSRTTRFSHQNIGNELSILPAVHSFPKNHPVMRILLMVIAFLVTSLGCTADSIGN